MYKAKNRDHGPENDQRCWVSTPLVSTILGGAWLCLDGVPLESVVEMTGLEL